MVSDHKFCSKTRYLTILYLYVNIKTHCCITNSIKKGVTSVLRAPSPQPGGLQCYGRDGTIDPGGRGECCEQEAERGGAAVLLTWAHAGHPTLHLKCKGDKMVSPQHFPLKLLKQNTITSLLLPLCFSLCRKRALSECLRRSGSCRLASLLQVCKVVESISVVNGLHFPQTLVTLFISSSVLPPFPTEAQKHFNSYLSRMSLKRSLGRQFWNSPLMQSSY